MELFRTVLDVTAVGERAVPVAAGALGHLIASGTGSARGPRVNGSVAWTLYEEMGETACPTHLTGRIQTDDGAEIHVDVLGYFVQNSPERPDRWTLEGGAVFRTTDARYGWMRSLVGRWSGSFDMATHQHRYRVSAA